MYHTCNGQQKALTCQSSLYRAVVYNPRGTAGTPVATPHFYSASYTDDLRAIIAHLERRFPGAPLVAAGYSLGANVLCRYLGEEGARTPLKAAVSLCNPFNLVREHPGQFYHLQTDNRTRRHRFASCSTWRDSVLNHLCPLLVVMATVWVPMVSARTLTLLRSAISLCIPLPCPGQ